MHTPAHRQAEGEEQTQLCCQRNEWPHLEVTVVMVAATEEQEAASREGLPVEVPTVEPTEVVAEDSEAAALDCGRSSNGPCADTAFCCLPPSTLSSSGRTDAAL